MSAAWIKEVLPLMAEGKYRGREDSEFLLAINKTGFMPDGS